MGKSILFSPVGGTDPVSNTNCYDGAMIHISRVYRPDKIYLYMSKETLDQEATDNRFTYCLKKLYKSYNKELDYSMIERPDLIEVQDFDFFYEEFKTEISKINREMDPDDTLYLNISSGTPAMKSALLVLTTLGDINGRTIQVTTPEKGMNEHKHKNYDVEMLWGLDPDNNEGFTNRCKETKCPSLALIKQEQIIKQFINSYDYSAALAVANKINNVYSDSYIHYLEYADFRLKRDYTSMLKLESKLDASIKLPIKSDAYRNTFEYTLTLLIKEKKEQYEDFIRGLTPLILELFIMVIYKECGINARNMCQKKKQGYIWDEEKVRNTKSTSDWPNILDSYYYKKKYRKFNWNDFLKSDHLLPLIEAYCSDEHITKLANDLREVEEKVRNSASHEIHTVTSDSIKKSTSHDSKEIVATIKELFNYSLPVPISNDAWNSYDQMNEIIINKINNSH